MNTNIDLTGLKGLHYPNIPNWWPLSYGWYVVLSCILLTGILIIYKKRTSPLTYVNKEIKKICKISSEKQLKELSQLLKRVAMLRYGRKEIAPLSEEVWQEFLLASAPGILTETQANLLAYAIYNPHSEVPDKPLLTACQKWMEKVLKK